MRQVTAGVGWGGNSACIDLGSGLPRRHSDPPPKQETCQREVASLPLPIGLFFGVFGTGNPGVTRQGAFRCRLQVNAFGTEVLASANTRAGPSLRTHSTSSGAVIAQLAQLCRCLGSARSLAGAIDAVDHPAVAARLFGAIEGLVGVFHQRAELDVAGEVGR